MKLHHLIFALSLSASAIQAHGGTLHTTATTLAETSTAADDGTPVAEKATGLTFKTIGKRQCAVTGVVDIDDNYTIPAKVRIKGKTYTVTTIGDDAFSGCNSLKSVSIPAGVTTIGDNAFNSCESLVSVSIPSTVTTIGEAAFWSCSALKSVSIPASVTTIGESAFVNCYSLTSIDLPESLTTIGPSMFWGCEALGNISIPEGVTAIGDYAFHNCIALKSASLPDSIEKLGIDVFNHCPALESIVTAEGCKAVRSTDGMLLSADGRTLIYGLPSNRGTFTLPASVNAITDFAFVDCTGIEAFVVASGNQAFTASDGLLLSKDMKTLVACPGKTNGLFNIPDYVTTITGQTFLNSDSITAIHIPAATTDIDEYAFMNSSPFCNIIVDPDNPVYCSINGHFITRKELEDSSIEADNTIDFEDDNHIQFLITGPSTCALTNLYKHGDYSVYNYAYYPYVFHLPTHTRHNGQDYTVNAIADHGLAGLQLKEIHIPEGYVTMGDSALCGCSRLETVNIPASLTHIGKHALITMRTEDISEANYYNLVYDFKAINVDPANPVFCSIDGVLFDKARTTLMAYPTNHAEQYAIPSGVTKINEHTFYNAGTTLQQLTIPASVTTIETGALGYSLDDGKPIASICNYARTPQPIEASEWFTTDITLHVPRGCAEAYRKAEGWQDCTIVDDL